MVLSPARLKAISDILASYPDKLPILPSSSVRAARTAFSQNADRKRLERTAAVLIPLVEHDSKPSLLFTVRSATVGSHRGDISFPGGHLESNETPAQAAMREAEEELGGSYDWSKIELLGQTQQVPAATGTMVHPVVAVLRQPICGDLSKVFKPAVGEVDMVFSRPIEDLLRTEGTEKLKRPGGVEFRAPFYSGPQGKIWGLTAIILKPILHTCFKPAFAE